MKSPFRLCLPVVICSAVGFILTCISLRIIVGEHYEISQTYLSYLGISAFLLLCTRLTLGRKWSAWRTLWSFLSLSISGPVLVALAINIALIIGLIFPSLS